MSYYFGVERLRNEIRLLVRENPELEEDNVLKADMIEAETSIEKVMDMLLKEQHRNSTQAYALTDYLDRITRRIERFEARVRAIRSLMFTLMQEAGIKKLERPLGTLSIATGKPKVIITNESQLPHWCWRIKKEPNKTAIAEQLIQGDCPGATWSNAEPHLTIRT